MVGKIGGFLIGVLAALLLDSRHGSARRAALNTWLVPVRRRLMDSTDPDSNGAASGGTAVPGPLHNVMDVAPRVQDRLGNVSALVSSAQTTVGRRTSQPDDAAASAQAPETRTSESSMQQATTTVQPKEVAPTQQVDPIPEGDPDEKHPGMMINDPTLVARVESELYRHNALPKGDLNIDAVHGVVTVRGTVKGEIADEILARTRAIDGVHAVVDKLHRA